MEPGISLPLQFFNSMFNFEAYRVFFRQSTGKAFLYLFVVAVVLAGLSGIKPLLEYNRAIDELISAMEAKIPYFELRDGELAVDAEMPCVIEDSPEYFFAIDTSNRLDESVLDDYPEGMLLTRHAVIHKVNRVQTNHFSYQSFGFNITRDDVARWLPALKWGVVFIALFGFMYYFCGKLISALILSVAGLIIESITGCKIGFGNIYKLTLYALTLPMVIKAGLSIAGVSVPLFWLIYHGIALFYLYKAITTAYDHRAGDAVGPGQWHN